MPNLFNRNKIPIKTPEAATESMNNRLEAIEGKIRAFDDDLRKIKQHYNSDRAMPAGVKKKAIDIMKRKKMYEDQRNSLLSQQYNLDSVSFANEQVQSNLATVEALKSSNKAMKAQMKRINVTQVEKLQDKMMDMMFEQNEITEILGRSYDINEINDDELEEEFDALLNDSSFDLEPATKTSGENVTDSKSSYLLDALQPASSTPMPEQKNTKEEEDLLSLQV